MVVVTDFVYVYSVLHVRLHNESHENLFVHVMCDLGCLGVTALKVEGWTLSIDPNNEHSNLEGMPMACSAFHTEKLPSLSPDTSSPYSPFASPHTKQQAVKDPNTTACTWKLPSFEFSMENVRYEGVPWGTCSHTKSLILAIFNLLSSWNSLVYGVRAGSWWSQYQ